MADPEVPLSPVLDRLAQARGTGEAAGGLVRMVVDGTGDIVDLSIDARVMRQGSEQVAEAVQAAFRAARVAVQQEMREAVPTRASGSDDLQRSLALVGEDAQRRLNEFAWIAQELSNRLGRVS